VPCYKTERVDGEVVVTLESASGESDASDGYGDVGGMFRTR